MKRIAARSSALIGTTVALLFVGNSMAHAQTGTWSLSTTGASSSGSWSTSAQTYSFSASVKDTKADGSCAYITFRPKVHYGYTGTWFGVGLSGYELRKEVCGNGTTLYTWPSINVLDKMSALDKTAGDKIKMNIRVCRNVNNAGDNCSEMDTPPIDF
ncbi:hypothetical protein [Terrabacter sp. NPDC000476]|uniref:hypothetical protein n=1 Tax=Terrabacter sp. NPDC000476 TaxID=3154258 RepID=UPI00331F8E6A